MLWEYFVRGHNSWIIFIKKDDNINDMKDSRAVITEQIILFSQTTSEQEDAQDCSKINSKQFQQ